MSEHKHPEMPSDELLVAFLDGELTGEERRRIGALVESDPEVAARYEFLSRSEMPFYDAFVPLLENAPASDLEAILARLPSPNAAEPRGQNWTRRGLLAAAVASVFVGVAIDRAYLRIKDDHEEADGSEWRSVVAEYLSLYTADTLADLANDPGVQTAQLQLISDWLGLQLPASALALPDIPLKRAQLLQYDGRPLGQLAFLDPEHGPLALCIVKSARGASAPQVEKRYGMNVVYWADAAHGYMLVGRNPVDQLSGLAEKLRTAISA
ncbi:anti-sigma factor [Phyllobacterium sp. SYP-B3895]|uniref:anti-sigma factor family protein n=1 Tax=Phyllobacterium sp. SYP-B3895 TaxID=2663240 RepID=UPI001FEE5458|nr:anti-sigma factor [Phyllobacterium sp. SYP-B3895]